MTLRVTFELSEKDLKHFRAIMKEARAAAEEKDDAAIVAAAEELLQSVHDVAVPEFVSVRLGRLQTLIDMLHDDEWQIPAPNRGRVLSALAYFTEPDDLIPDHIPGLGFLDDAIMVELVARELKHEIQAYEDFCKFRDELKQRSTGRDPMSREEKLSARRKALHERMRRRVSRRRRSRRERGSKYTGLF